MFESIKSWVIATTGTLNHITCLIRGEECSSREDHARKCARAWKNFAIKQKLSFDKCNKTMVAIAQDFWHERERSDALHRRAQKAESKIAVLTKRIRVIERENYLMRERLSEIEFDAAQANVERDLSESGYPDECEEASYDNVISEN